MCQAAPKTDRQIYDTGGTVFEKDVGGSFKRDDIQMQSLFIQARDFATLHE